jgi:hypothetical protein
MKHRRGWCDCTSKTKALFDTPQLRQSSCFLENNFMSNFMSRGELCFYSFTMCLTLWETVFREAGQRAGQRAGRLAIEVVKLLVKPLMKLYQTGPHNGVEKVQSTLRIQKCHLLEVVVVKSFGKYSVDLYNWFFLKKHYRENITRCFVL